MKKITTLMTMALICAAITLSCSKPKDGKDGASGPAGPKGDKGEQGPAGPQGVEGNAGVMMYTYGERTFYQAAQYNYPVNSVNPAKSLIYAYYLPSGSATWCFAPGIFLHGYEVRCYINPNSFNVSLFNYPAGTHHTAEVTWEEFRLVVVPIPDANITQLATAPASTSKGTLDYTNYAEVAKYYGLPE